MRSLPQAGLRAALVLLVLAPAALSAAEIRIGDLVIRQPWVRATPNGAEVAGGYLTIANHGTAPDVLTGGSFEAAATFGVHTMTAENGVMRMRPAGPVTILPGGTVTLSPAGLHLMFTGLTRGLRKGESIAGTLTFERAGTVPVQFAVEAIGARAPSQHEHAMPDEGMN